MAVPAVAAVYIRQMFLLEAMGIRHQPLRRKEIMVAQHLFLRLQTPVAVAEREKQEIQTGWGMVAMERPHLFPARL
jgi:hypothetical protein